MKTFVGVVVIMMAALLPISAYKLSSQSGITWVLGVVLALVILLGALSNTSPVSSSDMLRSATIIGVLAWLVARGTASMEPTQYVTAGYLVLHMEISMLLVQCIVLAIWQGGAKKPTRKRTRLSKEESSQPAVKELADIYNLICQEKVTEAIRRADKVKAKFTSEKIALALETLLEKLPVNTSSTLLRAMLREEE